MSVLGELADRLTGKVSDGFVRTLKAIDEANLLEKLGADLLAGGSGYRVDLDFPEKFVPDLMAGKATKASLSVSKKTEGGSDGR